MSAVAEIKRIPFLEYLSIDAASKHGLELMIRSPAHYLYALSHPNKPSPQQALGTLVHTLVQEPWRVASDFGVVDTDGRTKAGKEQRDAFAAAGITAITADQMTLARNMRDAVLSHPIASILYAVGHPELSLFWIDEETGLECKARPDWFNQDHSVIVDLKTAADASQEGFSRAAGNFGYHLQDAHYMDGGKKCGLNPHGFIFVVVENEPPHGVAIYTLNQQARNAGRIKIRRALNALADCKRTNEWPGYPVDVQTLELKPWNL